MWTKACDELEAELRRTGGDQTILLTGARMSGKTTVCETVLRRMNRHVVRWTPYAEFIVGDVSVAYSSLDTIIFVDDADVLVRLTKGSSVCLAHAINACKTRPHIRIVMTALDTRGRVWKSVSSLAGVVQSLPSPTCTDLHPAKICVKPMNGAVSEQAAWDVILRPADRAVAARLMINWSDARDGSEDSTGPVAHARKTDISQDFDKTDQISGSESDGGVVRTIAHLLLSSN